MTNNSNQTTENIVNDNAVYNIVNQVVKCDCNTAKHDPSDYECACADCLDEQIDRLNEMLIRKAEQDTENRIIKLLDDHRIYVDNETAWYWCEECDWSHKSELSFEEHLKELIKGEQK